MPAQEYRIRRDARQVRRDELTWQHNRLADGRLAMVGLAALLVWLTFSRHLVHPGWLAVPVILFTALAILHDRVLVARDRCPSGHGLLRPRPGADRRPLGRHWRRPAPPSSRRNIPTPRTWTCSAAARCSSCCRRRACSAGERTLANWLLAPASPARHRGAPGGRRGASPATRSARGARARRRRGVRTGSTRRSSRPGDRRRRCSPRRGRASSPFLLAGANVVSLVASFAYDAWAGWFALSDLASIAFTMRWRRAACRR